MAYPGWQSPHSASCIAVPPWASSLPRELQCEWGWHGREPQEAEKVPGGQDLHNVPRPGSCRRERVRTEPEARPESLPQPLTVFPGEADGQGELTTLGSCPGGHCRGAVDAAVARGQGSSWKGTGQDTLRAASTGAWQRRARCPLPQAQGPPVMGPPQASGAPSSRNPLCPKSNLPASALMHCHCPGEKGTHLLLESARKTPTGPGQALEPSGL